jgi:hypothetical protein
MLVESSPKPMSAVEDATVPALIAAVASIWPRSGRRRRW